MKIASIKNDLNFNNEKVSISVLMETEITKEIRILFKKGQEMKEHKTKFPITVEIYEGEINFGVNGEELNLEAGDLIYLDANVPHNLHAKRDSVVRLTLSKLDNIERVRKIIE